MKKKIMPLFLAVICILAMSMTTFAAEGSGSVTFEGGAEQFAEVQGDFTSFEGMMPGETKTQTIVLHNDDQAKVDFYISGEIVRNIAESADEEAQGVYTIELLRDGESFYSGLIGNGEDVGEEYLQDNYLLASLAKGEQTTVELKVGLDGDSMTDEYQLAEGQIDLTISSQYSKAPAEPTVITETVTKWVDGVRTTVKTGDTAVFLPYIIGIAAAVILMIGVIWYRRKNSKEAGHEK